MVGTGPSRWECAGALGRSVGLPEESAESKWQAGPEHNSRGEPAEGIEFQGTRAAATAANPPPLPLARLCPARTIRHLPSEESLAACLPHQWRHSRPRPPSGRTRLSSSSRSLSHLLVTRTPPCCCCQHRSPATLAHGPSPAASGPGKSWGRPPPGSASSCRANSLKSALARASSLPGDAGTGSRDPEHRRQCTMRAPGAPSRSTPTPGPPKQRHQARGVPPRSPR